MFLVELYNCPICGTEYTFSSNERLPCIDDFSISEVQVLKCLQVGAETMEVPLDIPPSAAVSVTSAVVPVLQGPVWRKSGIK